MKKKYLVLILIILSVLSIFVGVTDIKLTDIFALESTKIEILLTSRVPRLVSIVVAGIGLSISGLIMQQISRNKFVSPTTAATVDFAKLGILASMLVFSSATTMQKMIISFSFSLVGTMIFMKMTEAIKLKI